VPDRDVERIDRGERRVDGGAVGHVRLQVVAADLGDPLVGLTAVDAVDHRHARPARGELLRHREADVAGSPGDGDAEVLEVALGHGTETLPPRASRGGSVSALLRAPACSRLPRASRDARARTRPPWPATLPSC